MNQKTKLLLFLLFIPPLVELFSGSTPITEFFNPFLFLFVFLYGVGNIIIRELKVRWNLQWSVIFLAIAYGIFEEGLLVQSFFNKDFPDLGILSGHAYFLNTQWIWVLKLIFLHSTISTLFILYLSEYFFPKLKNQLLLSRKSWIIVLFSQIFLIALWFIAILQKQPPYQNYTLDPLTIISTIIIIFLLIFLAYLFRDSRIYSTSEPLSNKIYFIMGFISQFFIILIPDRLVEFNISDLNIVLYQLILILIVLIFTKKYLLIKNLHPSKPITFIYGSWLFYIFMTSFAELVLKMPSFKYTFITNITLIVLLELLRRSAKSTT